MFILFTTTLKIYIDKEKYTDDCTIDYLSIEVFPHVTCFSIEKHIYGNFTNIYRSRPKTYRLREWEYMNQFQDITIAVR